MQGRQEGFNPKTHKFIIEMLVLGLVVVALGIGAIWGGGRIAAAFTPLIPIEVDQKLGMVGETQIGLTLKDCPNPAAKKYVEDLAAPLLEAAGPLPFEFQFRVVKDPSINAFALPGGYVTVNSGLLEAAEGGEEVAGVLGHEIQHALLRHGTKRVLREMGGALVLSLLLGGTDLHALGKFAGDMVGLSYDRDQESEADREGVALLTRAKIDPSGLARFFERLTESGMTPPEILSTHPDPGNRAAEIRLSLPQGELRKLPPPSTVSCE